MNKQFELSKVAKRYRICGFTLASEIALPELPLASGSALEQDFDASFRVEDRVQRPAAQVDWFMSLTLPTGEPGLACAKEAGGYRLRFPELIDFRVDSSGRQIVCEAAEGIPPATIRHLLFDQVIPRVLGLLGREALHATAVLTPYGVCAFAGLSGAGKSTLAASFHLAGYPVLSDDCLVLQVQDNAILAIPAYPGVRLWADAAAALCAGRENLLPDAQYSSKRRVLADLGQVSSVPDREALVRIYDLGEAPGTNGVSGAGARIVEKIPSREAFMVLVTSGFRLDITDRTMLARQFNFLERVASLVPVRRLRIRKDFSALPSVLDAIFADLRATTEIRQQAA